MSSDELAREQAHLDRSYVALAAMRDRTERAVALAAADAKFGDFDSYATEAHLRHRLRELVLDVPGLAFGRIDPEDLPAGAEGYRIGRRHVETADGEPMVVDWRAPIATAFYRATPADPHGLQLRRRFATDQARIEALFDEDFNDPESLRLNHGGVPDPLLAELEKARSGEMRDIVATIAAEQDVVIRSPIDRCLVVQGGPGTGKTAVGLHRAAYLLYEHRRELLDTGVLVVGPNPTFLRYIKQVLPSLGETSVRQATLAGLVGLRADHPPEATERAPLLGDTRMAEIARRWLADTIRPLPERTRIRTSWGTVTLEPADVDEAVESIRGRGVPHDVGRNALRLQVLRLVNVLLKERRGELPLGDGELEADLRRTPAFAKVLNTVWPTVSGPALARRLMTSRTALERAADGVFEADEQRRILRRPARKLSDEAWTEPEATFVDECTAMVVGPPRSYGHVVVDEAQDLSALGYRAIARRCPSGSLTILGDLAQATAPAAQSSWDDVYVHLGRPATITHAELSLGYRVPAIILGWANRLLAEAAPDVIPARSVRPGGAPPRVDRVDDLVSGGLAALADLSERYATVGVIAPAELHDGLAPEVGRAQLVLPAEAKGLEFDGVVVIEPRAIVEVGINRASGLRLLYVALTRAVQALTVVHSRPLPSALEAEPQPSR